MGNRLDPHVDLLFEMQTIRRELVRLSLRDEQLDQDERSVIDRIDRMHARTTNIKNRHQLARLIEKGADPSDYMNEIAANIGCKIVNLGEMRTARKVIEFRPRNNDTAS